MLFVGQESTYSQAAKGLKKLLHSAADPKQSERLVHAYGPEVGQAVEDHLDQTLPTAKEAEHNYVMFDGAMILTREKGYKEVKLGRIFAASDHLPENHSRNWIRDSLYIGCLGSQSDFFKKIEPAVDRLKNPVFINDGAQCIWAWIDQYHPQSTQILDYYHATEYLHKFAQEQFTELLLREKWVEDQKKSLLENEIELVIADIEALKHRTKKANEEKKKVLTYYRNNTKRMKYKTYTEQGLMIGSGPIEAAHKTGIQERLKKSGQRWKIEGANAVIQLRTANKSEKWNLVVDTIKVAA